MAQSVTRNVMPGVTGSKEERDSRIRRKDIEVLQPAAQGSNAPEVSDRERVPRADAGC